MNVFALDATPVANNSHPQHKLFQQYSKSSKLTQRVYSLLVSNSHRRFSVEDIATLERCSYLSAYRACRKLIKLGVAKRIDISWPMANQRGQEKIMRRIGIEFQNWYSNGLKCQECEEVLSLA